MLTFLLSEVLCINQLPLSCLCFLYYDSEIKRKEKIGMKTFIAALVMFISGIVMFIVGSVYYWSSTGKEKHGQGKDILIVSGILLVPGIYGVVIIFGTYMEWPGYSYRQLPSYDGHD